MRHLVEPWFKRSLEGDRGIDKIWDCKSSGVVLVPRVPWYKIHKPVVVKFQVKVSLVSSETEFQRSRTRSCEGHG